nr:zinc finger, CCHC-type [Tanacetum cinerariifolium]
MTSMNTRLNIEKLDGNIVQRHEGSKQVGFKQLGPGVETGVHGVHNEKRVWFEVELQGAQGDREAEVFQVSNDVTVVAQRRLEDKQPEEKKNTDCLIKEQEKEYQTGRKIKTDNVFYSCNEWSTQQCVKSEVTKHLGVAGIQQQNGLVDETNVTLFAKVHCFLIRSDMSKVFWADDTTRSTYLVNRSPSLAIGFKKPIDMNMGFNESGEYKKTFIGFGTGSMQVLQGVEFKVEPQEDHTFEVEPHGNVDHVDGSQEVQTHDLMDYQLARDREQHLAYELFGYREDSNEAAFVVAAVEKIYAHESLTFNNTVACEGLLAKAKGNILSMEIVRDHSGNTPRVSQSRFYNGKLVQTLLEGHSILLLEGSLSGDCDVKKNGKWSCIYAVGSQEYQMVCTRLDIASVHVGMLDKFDRGLQTDVQEIWLKGLLTESRYELRLVAGIATGCIDEGGTWTQVTTLLGVAECWYMLI